MKVFNDKTRGVQEILIAVDGLGGVPGSGRPRRGARLTPRPLPQRRAATSCLHEQLRNITAAPSRPRERGPISTIKAP